MALCQNSRHVLFINSTVGTIGYMWKCMLLTHSDKKALEWNQTVLTAYCNTLYNILHLKEFVTVDTMIKLNDDRFENPLIENNRT